MKFSTFGGRSKITTTACIADDQPAQQVRGSVRIGVLPIRGTAAKFPLDSIEKLLINDHWINPGMVVGSTGPYRSRKLYSSTPIYALNRGNKQLLVRFLLDSGQCIAYEISRARPHDCHRCSPPIGPTPLAIRVGRLYAFSIGLAASRMDAPGFLGGQRMIDP
jgi:hypothetical protein